MDVKKSVFTERSENKIADLELKEICSSSKKSIAMNGFPIQNTQTC